MSDATFTDMQVRTANAEALDRTIQELPGCVAAVVDGSFDGEVCTVRCFEGDGFLRFAIINQGYGAIVERDPS